MGYRPGCGGDPMWGAEVARRAGSATRTTLGTTAEGRRGGEGGEGERERGTRKERRQSVDGVVAAALTRIRAHLTPIVVLGYVSPQRPAFALFCLPPASAPSSCSLPTPHLRAFFSPTFPPIASHPAPQSDRRLSRVCVAPADPSHPAAFHPVLPHTFRLAIASHSTEHHTLDPSRALSLPTDKPANAPTGVSRPRDTKSQRRGNSRQPRHPVPSPILQNFAALRPERSELAQRSIQETPADKGLTDRVGCDPSALTPLGCIFQG